MAVIDEPRVCLIECLHTLETGDESVKVGDAVKCPSCGLAGDIVSISEPPWEWAAVCNDCKYTRYAGKSAALAAIYSNKHRPDHTVRIRKMVGTER